jgi:hypothetical protein
MCQAHPSPGWGPAPRIRVGVLPSLPDCLVTLFSGGGGVPPSADLFCARLVPRGESPPPALFIVLLRCGGRDPSPAGAPLALLTLVLLCCLMGFWHSSSITTSTSLHAPMGVLVSIILLHVIAACLLWRFPRVSCLSDLFGIIKVRPCADTAFLLLLLCLVVATLLPATFTAGVIQHSNPASG